jgi:hypothetical protein
MKPSRWLALVVLVGCGLVNSNTLRYDYAFEPEHFNARLGDGQTTDTVPMVPCDPVVVPDPCGILPNGMPMQCDAVTRMCAAVVEVRLPYTVDLSQQSLPSPVVQYGVDKASVKKIAYWVMGNTVNLAIPPIDLYVASAAAKDENDPSAKKVGTLAMLPARSAACGDARDAEESTSNIVACDLDLQSDGEAALAEFVKDYHTPFQFIAHTTVVAKGGEPVPTGSIDFWVRPTVSFSVLK